MGNSVSVVVPVWGTDYAEFIPRWWESIRNLNRKPDEIVLVAENQDRSNLLGSVPDWCDIALRIVKTQCDHYQQWWSVAVHSASRDWIVQMPIDDQFASTGLDHIDTATGDLIIDKVQFLTGGEWPAVWEPEKPRNRRFAPAGVSPFHKRLLPIWDEIPEDCHWNDYVWYLLCAKHQVTVHRTDTLRMIHDLGHSHKTMSGLNLDQDTRVAADNQLAKIRSELGI